MAYADISKPVVIQASKQLSAKVDNYLRRMCIISQGGSSLDVGVWKEVGISQIDDILSKQTGNEVAASRLEKELRGFFTFSGDVKVMVLEVGTFDKSSNTISQQVNYLRQYILDASKKSYCHLVPKEWYFPPESQIEIPNSSLSLDTSFVGLRLPIPEGETLPEGVTEPITTKELDIITNIPSENLDVVYGTSGIASFNKETFEITALSQGSTSITLTGKIDPLKGGSATITFQVKVGVWNENLVLTEEEETASSTPISNTTNNGFETGPRDLAFVQLADEFVSMASKAYFFIEMTKNEDPSVSEAFEIYKNKKSVFCIYNNLAEASTFSLGSIILGICASSRYDYSDTQQGTPLNFKALTGQNFTALKKAFIDSLIQAPANFAGDLAGNAVVLNGRYTDGTPWEYYYQWDTLEFEISLKLQTLLLNGVNSPSNVIQYNQTGIDILKANIKSVLLLWQSRGIVTNFSKSLDSATGEMVGEQDISSIDFDKYIVSNPEDYKNEIYKGFSFYVMLGRYPRQIFIEATLN